MHVTETNAEGLKREFRVVVPAGELEEKVTNRLGEIGRTINLPGFRPGKVPMQILRRRFGPSVLGEVLESTVQGSSAEAIREHNLRPALPPKVDIVSFSEGNDLEYKMSLEVLPEIPEPRFTDLNIERLVVEVPDEDIDRALERIAEQQRKSEPVERPAENGDIIVADVEGRVDDREIPGASGKDRQIALGSGSFIPGFEDQLIGASAGEHRSLQVTFPEDYAAPDLAGKEALFAVDVKEVRQRLPVVIDDELGKAVGLESLAELRDEVRQQMQRDYDAASRFRLKRALLDRLAEAYDFPVPPGMVELEFENIWKQYQAEKEREAAAQSAATPDATPSGREPELAAATVGDAVTAAFPADSVSHETGPEATAMGGDAVTAAAPADSVSHETGPEATAMGGDAVTAAAPADSVSHETGPEAASTEPEIVEAGAPPAASESEDALRADYRGIAERRVRLGLLLAEVGRNNNITVTQDELNQAITREARRHPGYERQVLDFYRQNPEAAANLRAPIFEDKVIDFIVELAKVEERKITPQELLSTPDPDDVDTVAESTGAA
jgi:trigger factor